MAKISVQQGLDQHLTGFENAVRAVSVRMPESLDSLRRLAQKNTNESEFELAKCIKSNVPFYDLCSVTTSDVGAVSSLQEEWYRALDSGPGVIVLQNFFADRSVLERSNSIFDKIIEKEAALAKGDHFAASGANSRVWNSFQKHAEEDPSSFVRYYSNPWLAKVSEAWLGPGYQITAQVNIVRPGGKPQSAHRDYHLGFQTTSSCARFPRSIHIASQYLTLQGGVAHSDMPLGSGPTRLLPFSQLLPEGYMAWRVPEISQFFEENSVSVPMKTGDAIFFNPALLHAAGENTTKDINRSANLLQISSAFGRPMESINGIKLLRSCWEELKSFSRECDNGEYTVACIDAIAEGYPFPSNLDKRQPGSDGMAPTSEVDVLWEGLRADWDTEQITAAIKQLRADSSS
ncbi:hypothetical protein F5B20DRAFT_562242 [Whalleya microplaca]|nr:hypothetical protein F5B20DRAFT_562242 [Whalleya microplaca]